MWYIPSLKPLNAEAERKRMGGREGGEGEVGREKIKGSGWVRKQMCERIYRERENV